MADKNIVPGNSATKSKRSKKTGKRKITTGSNSDSSSPPKKSKVAGNDAATQILKDGQLKGGKKSKQRDNVSRTKALNDGAPHTLNDKASQEENKPADNPAASLADLKERLMESSAFFNRCVNLIPPQHYFAKTAEQEAELANKFYVNKKESAPKQVVKDASKKAKRARLDPSQHKSTVDVQQQRAAGAAVDADAENSNESGEDDIKVANGPMLEVAKGVAKGAAIENVSRNKLKERLEKRLQELRGSRKDGSKTANVKGKKAMAKLKAEKARAKIKLMKEIEGQKSASKKPLIEGAANKEGETMFSKFDFSTAERVGYQKKKGASTPMQLLAKIESKQKKIEDLRKKDADAADEKEKKDKIRAAMTKIEGGKAKTDASLLKKSINRIESKKKRSAKLWNEREDTIKKYQDEKQAKRKSNIKAKAQKRIDKKINRGKPKKSSSKRPGFEGSKKKPNKR